MRYALLLATLTLSFFLHAQETPFTPNSKFGKPTQEELTMTTYAPDSSATAVFLYKQTSAGYNWGIEDFRLTYRYKVRIKILKPEGTSYANITIPYYEPKNNSSRKETILQLNADAYNLENGKVVRTKMKKDPVFKERISDNYMQLKFSVPQVKEGTVIEYEYQCQSDLYYLIDDWKAQDEIPTLYTEYDITIPEYFKFNVDMHGFEPLSNKETPCNANFNINGHALQCSATNIQFKGYKLPALKDDNYVWCLDDYCTQVGFELKGLEFPGALYKSFTKSWEDIDEMLRSDSDFGSRLKMDNPLKEEMAALKLDQMKDCVEKTAAIYSLLKNKVRWNEKYALYGKSAKHIMKEGTGSNADINFILISMLKDAGIEAYPILLSRRSAGRLPMTHPSIQKLNTFVVGVAESDTTILYIDGSVEDGYVNTLPPTLLVDRARILTPTGSAWINLQNTEKNFIRCNVTATLAPNGSITGTRQAIYAGQHAANIRNKYRNAKDSTEFINKLSTEENITVKGYEAKNIKNFSPLVQETFQFEKQSTTNDQFIYVNPLIFLHVSESPFKQVERKLPVEYPYTSMLTVAVNLTLPEGYTIDEMPKSLQVVMKDQQIKCRYNITQKGNSISINYQFRQNTLLFAPNEYLELKTIWETIAEKNTEMLVLKKV